MAVIRWQLGNVAEWAVAIFTLLFFGATYLTIKRDHDEKRRQQEEARLDDAQRVYVGVAPTAGPPSPSGALTNLVGIEVTNNGRRQVDQVTVSVWNARGEARGVSTIGSVAAGYPRNDVLSWHDDLWDRTGFSGQVEMRFVDVNRTKWLLHPDKTLSSNPLKPKRWWQRRSGA